MPYQHEVHDLVLPVKPEDAYQFVLDALSTLGMIELQAPQIAKVHGIVGAGLLNLAPVKVVIQLIPEQDATRLRVDFNVYEGLIRQGFIAKAKDRLFKDLSLRVIQAGHRV